MRDVHGYWGGRSGGFELKAWEKACHYDGKCSVSYDELYRQLYIKVKNGWPTVYELPESGIHPTHSLQTITNSQLHRTWFRDSYIGEYDPDNVLEKFWNNCRADVYLGLPNYVNSFERYHFKLPNGQEIKLQNTIYSFIAMSGKETKYIYYNLSDSWVDVGYYHESWFGSDEWFLIDEWRVHGQNPNPYDAPDHIKAKWTLPPDPLFVPRAKIKVCYHLSPRPYGTPQYDNVSSIEEITRTSVPQETHITPVKGPWSGHIWTYDAYNKFIYNALSTSFKKVRIEQYSTYYRIYVSFGDGAPIDKTGWFVDKITEQNKWDPRTAGVTFDLLQDGTITIVDSSYSYIFPTETKNEIIYDTELRIFKMPLNYVIPSNMDSVLSPEGLVEYQRIYDEAAASFGLGEDYTNPLTIYLAERSTLVKKQLV
jgi:hypothetical protein